MNKKPPVRPASGIPLGDIYYVFFRHKWKIAIISAGSLIAALVLPLVWPLPFQSEAKLFVRYVEDTRTPSQAGANDSRVKSPDDRGENIINTELEILTSMDVALEVVTNVGADKILARINHGSDPHLAAAYVHAHLTAEVPKRSDVIDLVFKHPDVDMTTVVLGQIVDVYLKKHGEIHRSFGDFYDMFSRETDQIKSRLLQTEDELSKAKAEAGVTSYDSDVKSFKDQLAETMKAIYQARAELADRQAQVAELAKLFPSPAAPAAEAPAATSTNASPNVSTNAVAAAPPSEKVTAYKQVSEMLDLLRKHKQADELLYTAESPLIIVETRRIAEKEKEKQQLEDENPGLLAQVQLHDLHEAQPKTMDPDSGRRLDLALESAKITGLQTRIMELTNQQTWIEARAKRANDKEASIAELQRKRDLDEGNYKHFAANLEQSRIDEELGASHASNISKIQAPSTPYRDATKLMKARMMVLFGGIAGAFALAFLLEFQLDRSLKRPGDLEARLDLPLLVSIPFLHQNGKSHGLNGNGHKPLLVEANSNGHVNGNGNGNGRPSQDGEALVPAANGKIAPWDTSHVLHPFFEALRDRLISYFEVNNLTHKPKLVAVTSCGEGAGVTTIAAGLAASLSETGDGNVLLVDMNLQHGAAHHFYQGNLDCGLDDALETEKRGGALVQDNLYVVTESTNHDKLPRVLPKRFHSLVPKLKASDYDYIIFDMPPMGQISVTPRLTRFMDMVLLVVESEKSDRDVVKRAATLLSESNANVATILNKGRSYVPRRLLQEL